MSEDMGGATPEETPADPDADRRRLDWLEARGWLQVYGLPAVPAAPDAPPSARYSISTHAGRGAPTARGRGPTLRAAIDAAMAEWAAKGETGEAPDGA